MSYILEALKKSERERDLGRASAEGAVASAPAARRRSSFRLVVPAALVSAALAGLWVLGRGPDSPTVQTTTARPAIVREARAPAADPPTQPPPPAPAASIAAPAAPPAGGPVFVDPALVPFLRQLPEEYQRALPEMTVNIHVYVPEESARLLFINNRQVHKGEQVANGVRLEEIVPDGAVLSYYGQRFKLPRPR